MNAENFQQYFIPGRITHFDKIKFKVNRHISGISLDKMHRVQYRDYIDMH